MAGRGHEHDLRVGRIHGDTVDGLRFLETQVMPGFAAVCCAPDAVTDGRALTVIGLAGPDVYDVWIRRRNADGAYRLVLITVELRVPVIASIRRFPEPTSRKPDVHNHGIFFRALNIIEPPHHHCRTDRAELEASQRRALTADEKVHALSVDLAQWNKAMDGYEGRFEKYADTLLEEDTLLDFE